MTLTASIETRKDNGDRRYRVVIDDACGNRLMLGPWYPTEGWPHKEFAAVMMKSAIDNQINIEGCVVNTHVERLPGGAWIGCVRHLQDVILRTQEKATEAEAKIVLDHVLVTMKMGKITMTSGSEA